ncbi:MAG TPA: cupin domain-containing protein [Longimicrobium sp.]|jgi:mannose-6-phosphate isomerase-like protein (cupin superfamily)|nr:cupin domain-containing protein [Longimicrobium sp.]
MQIRQLRYDEGFQVAIGNDRAQAATMVLAPGDAEGGPDNRHRGADQWLYVVAGEGAATVEGEVHALRPGVVLLIERGEAHEIRNTGAGPLQTLNFYTPPAYTEDGDTLPAGEDD